MMKTYVIHVSDAIDREIHMNNQLEGKDLEFEFVLEGDIKDLSESVMSEYFNGEMSPAYASCTYKHVLAYERIAEGTDEIALILEDDIFFEPNFSPLLKQLISEIKQRKLSNFLISIEDSNLTYIGKSKRKKGILIYPEEKSRTAGAYLIDKIGARSILDEVRENKIRVPTDWFLNVCIKHNRINMYWSHPTIAYQGSLNGTIKSIIAYQGRLDGALRSPADENPELLGRVEKFGHFRAISMKIQKAYKKLLYEFR